MTDVDPAAVILTIMDRLDRAENVCEEVERHHRKHDCGLCGDDGDDPMECSIGQALREWRDARGALLDHIRAAEIVCEAVDAVDRASGDDRLEQAVAVLNGQTLDTWRKTRPR